MCNFNEVNLLDCVSNLNVVDYIKDDESECVYLKNSYNEIVNCLNFEVVDEVDFGDRIIVEGYTSRLTEYVGSNFNKVNIQLSITDEIVIVGYPLIKNSF